MGRLQTNYHIGTSGWSYKHWETIFYPARLRPEKFLEFYSTHFDTVEINTSFYNLPRENTIKGWVGRVPGNFRFCPKLSRYITHQLKLLNAGDALQKFFGLFEPMFPIMGPVLIQLPPQLSYDYERCISFFTLLKKDYGHIRFAIEVRHPSWINASFFSMLEAFNIAFTIADSGRRFPYHERVTADFLYIRFHGSGQLYSSDYNDEQMLQYAKKIVRWGKECSDVWIYFNNDVNGYAINNARALSAMIGALRNDKKNLEEG